MVREKRSSRPSCGHYWNFALQSEKGINQSVCRNMIELRAIVDHLIDPKNQGPVVLATLVTVEGSSYRRPGARLLLMPDGKRIGSISGGCLEEDLIARARQVAASGTAARSTDLARRSYNPQ